MDTIEFRAMNSSIQADANAAFVQPAQSYTSAGACGARSGDGNAPEYAQSNAAGRCAANSCGSDSSINRNGHIIYNGCEEIKINALGDKTIDATGRIMDVTMTLKNVCPCRRVSVGYMVTELDAQNNEHSCGFKCFTVPAHYNAGCCDVALEATRFILPDDARVDGGVGACSGRRHFIVRADAHYADTSVTMP